MSEFRLSGSAVKSIEEIAKSVSPIDSGWVLRAEARQRQLTKPPGSLGRLEEIACRLCAIQQTLRPVVTRRRIFVFAADHGVASEGVSAYPSEVTAQMVKNFCAGGAAINALSKTAGAELYVVDIGVADNTLEGIPAVREKVGRQATFIPRRIRHGTRNFVQGAALTEAEVLAALHVGIDLAEEAANEEVTLIGLGEMGIGNTTSASAITAAVTGLPPAQVTGRGTGADEVTFSRKVRTIERALAVNEPSADDALDVLRKVGGLEIAGLCGLCLGAAAARIGIVSDGFIATAGAALAVRIAPAVAGYIFAAHLSPEPGHLALLNLIGQRPLLNLEMRLGEGTGAALVLNIIDASVAAFNEMATFNAAGVSDKA